MSDVTAKFVSLFSGCKSEYVIHVPPFEHVGNNKIKAKGGVRFAKKDNKFLRLAKENYEEHLKGTTGLAVSPLMPKGEGVRDHCYFACIDIDQYNTGVEVENMERLLSANNIPGVVRKSKSGGFHIYFFFKDLEPAKEVRIVLKKMIYLLGFQNLWGKKVEIFPEFDEATDKHAKCIFLPFFDGLKDKEFLDFVRRCDKKVTKLEKLKKIVDSSRYNYLPVCIESILNSNYFVPIVNRNNFLFSVGIFLNKFKPENATELFWEIVDENFGRENFEEGELETSFKSAIEKDYSPLGRCKSEELKDVCKKEYCRLREIDGAKVIEQKDKKRVLTNIDFGQIYKYNTLNPFYIWEVRVAGDKDVPYSQVQFDDIRILLSQKAAQEQIGKVIDAIFLTVRADVWEKHTNDALAKVITIDVPLIADSTEQATLTRNIYLFLLEAEYPYDEPDCILQGHSYKKNGAYYFLTESVMVFLHSQRLITKNFNLYMALSNMGAKIKDMNGIEVWELYENDDFKRLVQSRERIRTIEAKQLLITDVKLLEDANKISTIVDEENTNEEKESKALTKRTTGVTKKRSRNA